MPPRSVRPRTSTTWTCVSTNASTCGPRASNAGAGCSRKRRGPGSLRGPANRRRLDHRSLERALGLPADAPADPEPPRTGGIRIDMEFSPKHVYELAKTFNDFYHACPVLKSEEPVKTARLTLVAATRVTLRNGLALLGIDAPVEM